MIQSLRSSTDRQLILMEDSSNAGKRSVKKTLTRKLASGSDWQRGDHSRDLRGHRSSSMTTSMVEQILT